METHDGCGGCEQVLASLLDRAQINRLAGESTPPNNHVNVVRPPYYQQSICGVSATRSLARSCVCRLTRLDDVRAPLSTCHDDDDNAPVLVLVRRRVIRSNQWMLACLLLGSEHELVGSASTPLDARGQSLVSTTRWLTDRQRSSSRRAAAVFVDDVLRRRRRRRRAAPLHRRRRFTTGQKNRTEGTRPRMHQHASAWSSLQVDYRHRINGLQRAGVDARRQQYSTTNITDRTAGRPAGPLNRPRTSYCKSLTTTPSIAMTTSDYGLGRNRPLVRPYISIFVHHSPAVSGQ